MALWPDSHCRARQAADIICQAGAGLLGWDTHHWASPALSQAGLSAMAGEMPAGRRQGLGRAGREPKVARNYTSGMTGISSSQAAGSDRSRERLPVLGQRGHGQPGEGHPPSLGSSGPASFGVAVGETCWVSSHVFPHKAGSCSPGCKVGVRGGSSLLMLTFT